MTLPRSAADVLNEHVVFEVECIDRMYLNLYQSRLQHELGLIGFLHDQLGCPVASTALQRYQSFGLDISGRLWRWDADSLTPTLSDAGAAAQEPASEPLDQLD